MFDKDTLIVSYDAKRGEPRGARKKAEQAQTQLGDCIDCSLCVQVCPTGIDIRNGLQYECISCAACIDACDSVMDRVGLPRGLIRYSTENGLKKQMNKRQIWQRMLRPRVLIYSAVLTLIVGAFFGTLLTRTPLKLDVIRDRGALSREVEDGMIENVYRLQVMNTDEAPHRYRISVSGIDSIELATAPEVEVEATASRGVPVRVRVAPGAGTPGSNKIQFELQSLDDERVRVSEKAVFFVPRN
jgi:cytochrome c oxidase accessory protein FixG